MTKLLRSIEIRNGKFANNYRGLRKVTELQVSLWKHVIVNNIFSQREVSSKSNERKLRFASTLLSCPEKKMTTDKNTRVRKTKRSLPRVVLTAHNRGMSPSSAEAPKIANVFQNSWNTILRGFRTL